jgi:hypothetical protein
MASHDRGLVALDEGDPELAATLLSQSLVDGAPVSRPLTRLALAEALTRSGQLEQAVQEVRATVLEPVRPSDFPQALVPRLARVQGLITLAAGKPAEAERRLQESIAGWERLLKRTVRAESITTVLADLGRPVVGLVEPERELERARTDLEAIVQGGLSAVVPRRHHLGRSARGGLETSLRPIPVPRLVDRHRDRRGDRLRMAPPIGLRRITCGHAGSARDDPGEPATGSPS